MTLRRTVIGTLLPIAAALSGCKYDPSGDYSGTLRETASLVRNVRPGEEPNTSKATVTDVNRPAKTVQVKVERAETGRVRVHLLPNCTVLFRQSESPNEHNAQVETKPPQRCTVEIEGWKGDVEVTGTALFPRDSSKQMQITVLSRFKDANASGQWALVFDATTP